MRISPTWKNTLHSRNFLVAGYWIGISVQISIAKKMLSKLHHLPFRQCIRSRRERDPTENRHCWRWGSYLFDFPGQWGWNVSPHLVQDAFLRLLWQGDLKEGRLSSRRILAFNWPYRNIRLSLGDYSERIVRQNFPLSGQVFSDPTQASWSLWKRFQVGKYAARDGCSGTQSTWSRQRFQLYL